MRGWKGVESSYCKKNRDTGCTGIETGTVLMVSPVSSSSSTMKH